MSNSGRKMSIPGWCTFAVIGGVLVVASGAFASATPQSKSEATLVPAAEKAGAPALIDQAGVVAVKSKAANSKENSSLASSTGAAASQEKISHDSASGLMSEDDSGLGGGPVCLCGTDFANGSPVCFEDTLCSDITPCGGGQACPVGFVCLANNCCPPPLDFGCNPICPDGPACNNPGVCGTYQACEGGGECPKDEVVFIESCDAPPIKVFGNTQGAGNDSLCRDSEDLIITFVILEAGNYTFDLIANVADPCPPVGWDSVMFLTAGDACTCTDVIASNDDCPGIGCFGLSCIGPVNLPPGEYWIVVEGFGGADAGPVDLHVTSECKAEECFKDEVVVIESCDAPPIKVFGNTLGAGNDSLCRASEDLIITFDILQAGLYTFDLTANVDAPNLIWDSVMFLVAGDACTCTDVIASNDDCIVDAPGLSCIGPVNLPPGEYWIVVEGFGAADAGPVDLHVTSECKPCLKDVVVTIPSCDAQPIKVFGDTQGAGNDSTCRPSEDMIITFVILEAGNYTFDLTANDPPSTWDSYMFLTAGDACTCTDVIASNDDCIVFSFGLSCIGPVNLPPGEYWIVVEGFGAADAGPVDLHITSECKPFCGDGVVNQPGEQCDTPDDAACPGQCLPPGLPGECTCPQEPHEVWDMVWSEASIVQWGPAWWTINGVPICHTFPDGVKTGPDNPHDWDHIVCPGWPNDWHWDAWFDWFGIPAHISVWFENFGPDDAVEIQLYCSPKWLEYMIQIDIGNNIYTLMDANGIPFWEAPWSDGNGFAGGGYPGNLPPGFDPTGNTRGNRLMCDDCRFDLDASGDVDAFDLANLLGGWGCPVAHNIVCFDVNMNNCIEAFDLANLLGSWGPCAP